MKVQGEKIKNGEGEKGKIASKMGLYVFRFRLWEEQFLINLWYGTTSILDDPDNYIEIIQSDSY